MYTSCSPFPSLSLLARAGRCGWRECPKCDTTGGGWNSPLAPEVYNNLEGSPAGSCADIIELHGGSGETSRSFSLKKARALAAGGAHDRNVPSTVLGFFSCSYRCSFIRDMLPLFLRLVSCSRGSLFLVFPPALRSSGTRCRPL